MLSLLFFLMFLNFVIDAVAIGWQWTAQSIKYQCLRGINSVYYSSEIICQVPKYKFENLSYSPQVFCIIFSLQYFRAEIIFRQLDSRIGPIMSFTPFQANIDRICNSQVPPSAQTNLFYLNLIKQTLQKQIVQKMAENIYLRSVVQINNAKAEKKQNSSETKQSNSNKQDNSQQSQRDGVKNDTKNIPKNFGKAIITFIQKQDKVVKRLLVSFKVNYSQFVAALKARKRNLNSIADLRSLWVDGQFRYAKITRMLSLYFLKRGALRYIFGSRVVNYQGHIKYRKRLIEVLKRPQQFTSIKTG